MVRATLLKYDMKDQQFAKLVVFVNSLVPLAVLVWDATHEQLGVNPAESALHTTGNLAIIFLLLSLAVTPLRMVTGKNYWSLFRKMLGLYAFFYACTHLGIYYVFYASLELRKFAAALVSNQFIILGLASVLMMLPLALTSTNGSIKRLGARKWKALHKLAYVAAISGVAHFWISQKRDTTNPKIAAAILFALLAYRFVKSKPWKPPLAKTATPT